MLLEAGMDVRMQFTSTALTEMLRERLRAQDLCFDPIDEHTFVDRIEIPDLGAKVRNGTTPGTERHAWIPVAEFSAGTPKAGPAMQAMGPRVEVVIPFTVETVRLLPAPWHPGEPLVHLLIPDQTIPLQAVLAIDVSPDGSNLTVAFLRVEPPGGGTDPRLDPLNAMLAAKIGTQQAPFLDVPGALRSIGATTLETAWSALAYDDDEEIVEVRVEYEEVAATYHLEDWQYFYGGHCPSLLRGEDWALFIDKDIILPIVGGIFHRALTGSADFALRSPVFPAWQPDPLVVVTFRGTAFNVCSCFFTKIDVPTDVTATITFRLDGSELVLDVSLGYSPDTGAEFCCELSAGIFFPIIGKQLLDQEQITTGQYVLGLVGYMLSAGAQDFTAAVLLAGSLHPPIPDPGGACAKVDDTHIECRYPLPIMDAPGYCARWFPSARTPTAIRGSPAGLVLAGTLSVARIAAADVEVTSTGFAWTFPVPTCSGSAGVLRSSASVTVRDPGWSRDQPRAALFACDAMVLGHPEYTPFLSETFSYCPVVATVHLDLPPQLNPTASVEVLIRTSAGVRLTTIEANPSQPDEAGWNKQALQWRVDHCYTKEVPWWQAFHRFNPHWMIDPAGPGERERHLWQVQLAGLPPGATLVLAGPDDVPLAHRRSTAAGSVVQAVLTEPAGEAELGLLLEDAAEQRAQAGPGGRMEFRQLRLVQVGLLPVGTAGRAIGGGALAGMRSLTLVFPGLIEEFDLADPARPRLARRFAIEGIIDVIADPAGALGYGPGGLFRILATEHGQDVDLLLDREVTSVARLGERIFVLSEGRLLRLGGPADQRFGTDRYLRLDAVGQVLCAARESAVELFGSTGDGGLDRLSTIHAENVVCCRSGRSGPSSDLEVCLADGGTSIFDLSTPAQPVLVARHRPGSSPGELLRCGGIWVSPEHDQKTLRIEVMDATRRI
jgi:hypothetical protein